MSSTYNKILNELEAVGCIMLLCPEEFQEEKKIKYLCPTGHKNTILVKDWYYELKVNGKICDICTPRRLMIEIMKIYAPIEGNEVPAEP